MAPLSPPRSATKPPRTTWTPCAKTPSAACSVPPGKNWPRPSMPSTRMPRPGPTGRRPCSRPRNATKNFPAAPSPSPTPAKPPGPLRKWPGSTTAAVWPTMPCCAPPVSGPTGSRTHGAPWNCWTGSAGTILAATCTPKHAACSRNSLRPRLPRVLLCSLPVRYPTPPGRRCPPSPAAL